MSKHPKYVRNCARGRARDLSHRSMSHWLFFAQAHTCFHGIGVRPVMLGATCYLASANDGAACNKLGRVCTYKLGSPATFSSLAKNLTVTTSLEITSNHQSFRSCFEKGSLHIRCSMDT